MRNRWIIFAIFLTLVSACTNTAPPTVIEPPVDTLFAPEKPATETPTASPSPVLPTETLSPTATTNLPTATQAMVAYGPNNFPANISPLTGLQVTDPSILERRPVSVKVQIFPRGQRPPMGVAQADVVYDYYQNTGMTRFHALFYSDNAEQVGPIRSGRLLDSHLVQMYKSVLAFGGADRRILNRYFSSDFADRLVLEGNGKCPPMCRIDPNGFNYLVANTGEVSNYATENLSDNERQNLDGMTFHSLTPLGGQPATQIFIRYSISAYNRWDYDPVKGKYFRYQDIQEAPTQENEALEAMVDKMTGEQLTADNVVVLFVPHRYAFQTSPGLNEIIEIVLDGSGSAYAFRDGQVYEVQWHRPAKESVLYLTFPDGASYPFKPGNTWFQVIGQTSTQQVEAGVGSYRFQFAIP